MKWYQNEIVLGPYVRGFHLITNEVLAAIPELKNVRTGTLHVFIKHTSASLTINENADHSVARDLETHFNKMVPENMPYYRHTYEGSDDMPAHIKASLLGNSVIIPVTNGQINLGSWQGIFLGEHRNHATPRKLVITLNGISF
jgi:secondary thiamine-phosphate synthase enzyme